ncbi:hypothetical protein [uncultured Clostridium sp.]|jgi:hypothetical protein|uniref:hypothetical protein n=1 Tax=uncultured Clostridium sp. TaxID=59620 RepID=UPI0026261764|nr:hypothetical protein [uncultured Clostridium sp.]
MKKKMMILTCLGGLLIVGGGLHFLASLSGTRFTGNIDFDKTDNTKIEIVLDGSKIDNKAEATINGYIKSGSFEVELIDSKKTVLLEKTISDAGNFEDEFKFTKAEGDITLIIYPKSVEGKVNYVIK